MPRIKNIKQLREDLLRSYESSTTEEELEELSKKTAAASTIIRSAKIELEYNKYKGVKTEIPFLNSNKN